MPKWYEKPVVTQAQLIDHLLGILESKLLMDPAYGKIHSRCWGSRRVFSFKSNMVAGFYEVTVVYQDNRVGRGFTIRLGESLYVRPDGLFEKVPDRDNPKRTDTYWNEHTVPNAGMLDMAEALVRGIQGCGEGFWHKKRGDISHCFTCPYQLRCASDGQQRYKVEDYYAAESGV